MGSCDSTRDADSGDLPTKKAPCGALSFEDLAQWTGLEPAPPGVTGRYWRKAANNHECAFFKNQ
jgi:hypothetical protein